METYEDIIGSAMMTDDREKQELAVMRAGLKFAVERHIF